MRLSRPLPPGYEAVEVGKAQGFAVTEASGWLQEALGTHGTLEAWGTSSRGDEVVGGRGSISVVSAPLTGPQHRDRWAVRHYRRGGAVARLMHDRYLASGRPRPLRELEASVAARDEGIRTPTIVAGAVYPDGRFYRADLVTELVPGARDLAEVLFEAGAAQDSGSAQDILAGAAELITALATAGIRHPDLNATNIVLEEESGEAWVLDLDRCSLGAEAEVAAAAMRSRLMRSLRKVAAARGTAVPPDWSRALAGGEGA